jgi:hypothetical protein
MLSTIDPKQHIGDRNRAVLGQSRENNLKEEVAQFLRNPSGSSIDRFADLVGFLQKVGFHGFMVLFLSQGQPSRPQRRNDIHESLKLIEGNGQSPCLGDIKRRPLMPAS